MKYYSNETATFYHSKSKEELITELIDTVETADNLYSDLYKLNERRIRSNRNYFIAGLWLGMAIIILVDYILT